MIYGLVVSNMFVIFHFIYGIILPIDELIVFKMVIAPPTRLSLRINHVILVPNFDHPGDISPGSYWLQVGPWA